MLLFGIVVFGLPRSGCILISCRCGQLGVHGGTVVMTLSQKVRLGFGGTKPFHAHLFQFPGFFWIKEFIGQLVWFLQQENFDFFSRPIFWKILKWPSNHHRLTYFKITKIGSQICPKVSCVQIWQRNSKRKCPK